MPKLFPVRIRNMLRKNLSDTQTRLLLILMIPVLFIILTVGFSSYYTSKDILQQELNEPQHQMLTINMNSIDEYLIESDQIAVKLALDNDVYRFLTDQSQFSYQNIKEIYDKIATITKNSSFIQSIYIYNVNSDSFVAIPQGFSSSSATFNDAEWTSVLDEFHETSRIVKYRDLPNGAKYKGSNISLFRKINLKGETKGIVAINLNQAELFSALKSSADPQSNSMQYILDQNNTILHTTKNHTFGKDTVQFVNKEVSKGNLSDITYNDKILLANQIESDFTGWKYISVVSQESILAKSKAIRDVVFIVSLIALIIGGIAIFFIHSVELKPLRRMKELFSVDDDPLYKRDLLHLENIIDDLVSDHAQLSQLIKKMKIEAKSKFLYDIYIGRLMNRSEQKEKWQAYFKEWNDDNIQLLVVSIDNYPAWKESVAGNYRTVVKSGMVNILTEVLSTHYSVEAVDIGRDRMIIIIQHLEGKINVENHLKIALSHVENILGFSVSLGLKQTGVQFLDLKNAMNEAEEALQYRLFDGYGNIHIMTDQKEEDKETEIIEKIDSLVKSITLEDPMQSIDDVTTLFQLFRESNISPELAFYFIEQVRKVVFSKNKEITNSSFLTSEEIQTMNLQDIANVFKERISERIENIKKLNDSKRYVMCRKMIQYMNVHVGEPIGIPEIAESVGVSVSLASQWFKEEMNDTIYGYFTRLRMERAQELLIKTDKKIADIAFEVGYQHENSFIRKFREYKEMTPGKYRRLNTVVENKEKNFRGGN
ncbi:helix-turn-helix domain-containing protein [Gracilibacillus salitolerans]|uniref:Helix-turn-helix domain-containing protein n=1 Tax=Gracilibacillus salitolerans TaxID=2663022 RepID=A0A5Q2TG46_9BACI|nr:AraC family transcriptional regulator [Gracilibacillus salitolerans]QGH32983.1 helix-turn-helix domain-containing protein [Gracilibacillus salitolerans]